jgi:hypothetical protein
LGHLQGDHREHPVGVVPSILDHRGKLLGVNLEPLFTLAAAGLLRPQPVV